jgi:hypothetical protein
MLGFINLARAAEARHGRVIAMRFLGLAMHTLQDSTSPSHHGFQAWTDYPGGGLNPGEWPHGAVELIYPGTGSQLELATDRAYRYFTGEDPMPVDFFADLYDDLPAETIRRRWFEVPDDLHGVRLDPLDGIRF